MMRPYGMVRAMNGKRFPFNKGKPCPCCLHGWEKTRIQGKKKSGKSTRKRQMKRVARREAKHVISMQLHE